VGVLGVLLFLGIPLMLATGVMSLLFVSLIKVIFGVFLYLLFSSYMVWWGFIDKENPEHHKSNNHTLNVIFKWFEEIDFGYYITTIFWIIIVIVLVVLLIYLILPSNYKELVLSLFHPQL